MTNRPEGKRVQTRTFPCLKPFIVMSKKRVRLSFLERDLFFCCFIAIQMVNAHCVNRSRRLLLFNIAICRKGESWLLLLDLILTVSKLIYIGELSGSVESVAL